MSDKGSQMDLSGRGMSQDMLLAMKQEEAARATLQELTEEFRARTPNDGTLLGGQDAVVPLRAELNRLIRSNQIKAQQLYALRNSLRTQRVASAPASPTRITAVLRDLKTQIAEVERRTEEESLEQETIAVQQETILRALVRAT